MLKIRVMESFRLRLVFHMIFDIRVNDNEVDRQIWDGNNVLDRKKKQVSLLKNEFPM